jgi:hypothetical protein
MRREPARFWVCVAIAILFFANFAACGAIAVSIGGDALNGKVEGDRYFLRLHSRYTEVSRGVYIYSYLHIIGVLLTFPLGGMALYALRPQASQADDA